jgi:large subunit ribosomal protein L21
MNFAVFRYNNKQYMANENETLHIDLMAKNKNDKIIFDQVLLIKNNEKYLIGQPIINKAKIEAIVLGQVKEPKIRVAKFRAKSRYRKVRGQTRIKTKVKILNIIN